MVTMMGCVTKLRWGQQPQRKLSPNAHHFFVFFFKADGSFSGFACLFFVFLDKGSKKKQASSSGYEEGQRVAGQLEPLKGHRQQMVSVPLPNTFI